MLGDLLQFGGNLAATLLNKPKERSPRETILSTVQGAREAGIHPLAALGAQPQFQTVGGGVSTGSAVGEAVAGLGSSITRRQAEAPGDALTRASTEAQLAQAELFRAQSRSIIANTAAGAIGGPLTKGSGPPKWDSSRQETSAPMQLFGNDFVPREGDPSSERAQEWFGEPGEFLQALSNLMRSNPGSLPTDEFDRKVVRALRSWYVRNRGNSASGPMP